MLDVIRAEWWKAWTGKAWWVLPAIAVPWILMVVFGTLSDVEEAANQGLVDSGALTTDLVKQWFQMLLFNALLGAVLVSREFGTRTISRSALLSGRRSHLFWAKLVVATAVAVGYSAVATALAPVSAWLFMGTVEAPFTWTDETTWTLLGVFAVGVLGAPWGVLIAWIVRSQVAAVSTVLGLMLLVEPGLQRIAPDVSAFTYSIALSAIYRDGKPELLSVPWAFVVVACWLVAAGVIAHYVLARQDIP